MVKKALFVHAHPNDETVFTAAAIATLVDQGVTVMVLTCTRGELGAVIAPELQHLATDPDALGLHREQELTAALAALGVTDRRFLGEDGARWQGRPARQYRDSGMREGPHGPLALEQPDPRSLLAADSGEVAADIASAMFAFEPDAVVTYKADGGHGHPDHIRVHETTRLAAEVMGIPFFVVGTSWGDVVDPTVVLDRKRRAVQAHRSQLALENDRIIISPRASVPLDAKETYRRVRPSVSSWADYGVGARILTSFFGGVLGVFVGVILSISHQATLTVSGSAVPLGIITALVIAFALLAGLRLVFETRIVAAVAGVGLLAASAFVLLQSENGSVIVPTNLVGQIWTFGSIVIVVGLVAWPQFRPRERGNIGETSAKGSVSQ